MELSDFIRDLDPSINIKKCYYLFKKFDNNSDKKIEIIEFKEYLEKIVADELKNNPSLLSVSVKLYLCN